MAYWLVSMASEVSTISPAVGVDLRDRLRRYAFVAAFVSSVGQLVSIFVAHTALAAACVGLVASKERIRVPPIAIPLVGFVSWTLLSLAFSDDPAAGWPQVRKLLVFLTLPVVFSLFRTMSQVQRLLEALFVAMLASSITALGQFAWKAGEAYANGQSFYYSYVGRRITGFFSHWMTFSQVLMLVALILASYLLFSQKQRWRGRGVWLGVGAVLGVVLLLSYTRSTWAAALAGGAYLIWHWKPRLLWIAPIGFVLLLGIAPEPVRQRLKSVSEPDSYSNRFLMWQTGVRMVEAHPWFGVGPERVRERFDDFQPTGAGERPPGYYSHLHNVVIHYAAERGIPATIFILWFLLAVFRDHASAARGQIRAVHRLSWLLHGVAASTVGLLVAGLFDQSLGDSEILGTYLVSVALGYRIIALGKVGNAC